MRAMRTALTIPDPADLATWGDRKLDNAIRKGHVAAGAHRSAYEQHATVTGLLLIERKQRLGHGAWLPWLAENFEGSPRTAQLYVKAAEEWASNAKAASHFDPPAEPPKALPEEPEEAPRRRPAVTPEELEEELRRQAAKPEPRPTPPPPPAPEAPEDDLYVSVLNALDALSRARGAAVAAGELATVGSMTEAHRIVRREVMSMHARGGLSAA